MSNFKMSKRVNTSQSLDTFKECVNSHVQRLANNVELDGNTFTASRLGSSAVDAHCDVTKFAISRSGNGFLVNTETKFKATFVSLLWILFALLTFPIGLIIVLILNVRQKRIVKEGLQSVFDLIESEAEGAAPMSQMAGMPYQQPMMQVPNMAGMMGGNGFGDPLIESQPSEAVEIAPDPIQEVERLGALMSQGLLSKEEFEHQKRKILGLPDPPAQAPKPTAPEPSRNGTPANGVNYFLRRGEKVIGPVSVPKLKEMRGQKKLKTTDLIGVAKTGPWFKFPDVHKAIIDEGKTLPKSKA